MTRLLDHLNHLPLGDLAAHAALGLLATVLAIVALKGLVALIDLAIGVHIPTTPWMGWVCWLNGHDTVDHLSDEHAPYRHRCVRCGWRHPLDGQ